MAPNSGFFISFAKVSALFFLPLHSVAASHQDPIFEKTFVEGATCGNGEPYAFYLRPGRADKVVFELKGGGACWDFLTCFGPVPLTKLHLQEPLHGSGISSPESRNSLLFDATYVTFPYCTGDVHAGRHVAIYGSRRVSHYGGINIEKSFDLLAKREGFFENTKEIYFIGGSAGAVGAILHLKSLDEWLGSDTKRVALFDSPGLHFGKGFWGKFPAAFFNDVAQQMELIGVPLEREKGNISPEMSGLCSRFSSWKMGFIQSTRDRMMSLIFGNITQMAHERSVLSQEGLSQLARIQAGQCEVFVHGSGEHTFLGSAQNQERKTKNTTVRAFVEALIRDEEGFSILP